MSQQLFTRHLPITTKVLNDLDAWTPRERDLAFALQQAFIEAIKDRRAEYGNCGHHNAASTLRQLLDELGAIDLSKQGG